MRTLGVTALILGVAGGVTPVRGQREREQAIDAAFGRLLAQVADLGDEWHVPPARAWAAKPALWSDVPAELQGGAARAYLLQQVEDHRKPATLGATAWKLPVHAGSVGRQGLALSLLANDPSPAEASAVAVLLREDGIWEAWRAALVLGASGAPQYADDLAGVLEIEKDGWGGGQTALAIGMLGHPRGGDLIERFLRDRFGTLEFALGVEGLRMLGRQASGRAAVIAACWRLFRDHPAGTAVVGDLTVQLDHPYRVRQLQAAAMDVLWQIGALEDPAVAAEALAAFEARSMTWAEHAFVADMLGNPRVAVATADVERRVAAALRHDHPSVRAAAIRAVARRGLAASSRIALAAALADPDESVRTAAFDALRTIHDRTYAYNPQAAPVTQAAAIQTWTAWARQ